MLTNFTTVHKRLQRLKELEEIDFDAVSHVLQPAGNRTLCDTLSECREVDGFAHAFVSFETINV
jgi:ribosomal protein S2